MVEAVRKRKCLTCNTEFSLGEETGICPNDGSLLAPVNEDPLLGTLFDGKYNISEILGEGGFGRVYKANHVLLHKTVALKVLLADLQNLEGLDRFQTEARATHQLTHSNLVSVFDYGISPRPYIVMEYVDGVTLDVIIEREGPLSIERFIAMFDQICQGMSAAHERKLLHRDLKPSNIIVDNHTGTAKVLDFGVVKVFGEDKTATGQTVGSPPYMSPEQCMGKELDVRADVYSLGCVMYEALSGVRAFAGENAVECMYKHFNHSPQRISQLRKGVPAGMDYLIAKTMADYGDRYKSMEDLRNDLLKVAEGRMSKRLPKVSRVTYRKTVKVLAEISMVGNWTIITCAVIIYALLLLSQ